jgi:copper(I)-binding protein
MSYHTKGELNKMAEQIAETIAKTDISQRQELYELVAGNLVIKMQNYQASLFVQIAKVA